MMIHQLHISKNIIRINVMLMGITFFVTQLWAQSSPISGIKVPISNSYINYFEATLNRISDTTTSFFTAIKPYNPQELKTVIDSFQTAQILRGVKFEEKWLGRKIFNEDLISIKGDNFALFLNPAVHFSIGRDANWDKYSPFTNTRGFRLTGNITSKFHYDSEFYENQIIFPEYIHLYSDEKKVVPGIGYSIFVNNSRAKDFSYAMGGISYQPNSFFYFRLGHGKHFLGDGYRSLLLSDNAPPYPYMQIMTSFWKIRYVNLWAQMLDNNRIGFDGAYARKYVSSHYLSFNISKRLNIGLFESVIYGDSIGTRGLDVNFLNPIIFFRPIESSLNSNAGNVLLGLSLKYKLTNKQLFYAQFILDEFNFNELRKKSGWWANKFGYQIGAKSFNTFIPNLTLQAEYNHVRPYTYSHALVLQNYGHYNQPIAHPLGSNFKEILTQARYFHKRLFVEGRLVWAEQGRDSSSKSYGSNLYASYDDRPREFGNYFLQGIKNKIFFAEFKTGYTINPKTALRFEIGINIRQQTPEIELNGLNKELTRYYFIGLRTDLNNFYHDF